MKKLIIFILILISCKSKIKDFKKIDFHISLSHLGGLLKWEGKIYFKNKKLFLKCIHIQKSIRPPKPLDTLKIIEKEIEFDSISQLLNIEPTKFKLSPIEKTCFSGITDFYPIFHFILLFERDTIEIKSNSNCKFFVPWNIKYKNHIYIDEKGILYNKLIRYILIKGEITLEGEELPLPYFR